MIQRILIFILFSFMSFSKYAQETQPSRLKEPELLRQFEVEFNQRGSQELFSGAVLIAKKNQIIFEKACGFADREKKTPNTTKTRFNLGSMNKMFTSISIAQLVSQGRLQYSDTIARILPDYPNQNAAQKITVEHLMTHASGLADLFTDEFMRDRKKIRNLKDYLPYFANHPLQFEPGSKKSYSNAGFVVAGLIVEKVSGKNYFDYIKENIYNKAGMADSFGFEDLKPRSSMAIGYTRERGTLEPNDFILVAGSPAGGGYSTVSDLMKFATALKQEKFISGALLQKVLGFDRPKGSTYGYGFTREEIGSDMVVGHAGGAEGINADTDIYWKSGYVVIALANQDPRAAEEVTKWIRDRIQPVP